MSDEYLFTAAFGLGILFSLAAFAEPVVKDGDDLLINGIDHRFEGVDAFELSQKCKDKKGNVYQCGENAKAALEDLIKAKPLDCRGAGNARDGRPMLRCSAEIDLIRQGWAFPRRDFLEEDQDRFIELCAAEKQARDARRGAWAGTFQIPFVQKNKTEAKAWFVSCPDSPFITRAVEEHSTAIETSTPAGPIELKPAEATVEPTQAAPAPPMNTATREAVSSVSEDHGEVRVGFAQWLSALLTPAIALLAAVIAWAQWRVVRRREIMELFERRFAIYDALRKVIGQVIPTGKVTDKNLLDFLEASDRTRFLFGDDVVKYVDGLYHQLLKHQQAETTMAMGAGASGFERAVNSKTDSFKEISNFYTSFPKLIASYVRMDQKSPR